MELWNRRAPEIAYFLNPAFCSTVLYSTIYEYQKKAKDGYPFTLTYLVLPIVLHKSTRERVSSRSNMVVWLQKNPDVLIGFPDRVRSLVSFTNEAIEFLLHQGIITIEHGRLSIIKTISKTKLKEYAETDSEIADCLQKSEHVGRWFEKMGAEENIYAVWGVKP